MIVGLGFPSPCWVAALRCLGGNRTKGWSPESEVSQVAWFRQPPAAEFGWMANTELCYLTEGSGGEVSVRHTPPSTAGMSQRIPQ